MRRVLFIAMLLAPAAWSGDNWTVDSDDGAAIWQDGGNAIKDESYTRDVVPRLRFACSDGGDVIASIDWRRFISSFNTEVGFKVDGGAFTWLKWKVDSSEKVTLSPSAADTQKLLGAIGDGTELLVDITPYSESPVTVTFELEGLNDALDALRTSCGR